MNTGTYNEIISISSGKSRPMKYIVLKSALKLISLGEKLTLNADISNSYSHAKAVESFKFKFLNMANLKNKPTGLCLVQKQIQFSNTSYYRIFPS